jgi:hypothetical protein
VHVPPLGPPNDREMSPPCPSRRSARSRANYFFLWRFIGGRVALSWRVVRRLSSDPCCAIALRGTAASRRTESKRRAPDCRENGSRCRTETGGTGCTVAHRRCAGVLIFRSTGTALVLQSPRVARPPPSIGRSSYVRRFLHYTHPKTIGLNVELTMKLPNDTLVYK